MTLKVTAHYQRRGTTSEEHKRPGPQQYSSDTQFSSNGESYGATIELAYDPATESPWDVISQAFTIAKESVQAQLEGAKVPSIERQIEDIQAAFPGATVETGGDATVTTLTPAPSAPSGGSVPDDPASYTGSAKQWARAKILEMMSQDEGLAQATPQAKERFFQLGWWDNRIEKAERGGRGPDFKGKRNTPQADLPVWIEEYSG